VVRAYETDRLDVTMTIANPGFARLQVTDPSFDADTFVLARRAIRRLPMAEFMPYKVENTEAHALIERTMRWADELRNRS
jgi:hypothetical protein